MRHFKASTAQTKAKLEHQNKTNTFLCMFTEFIWWKTRIHWLDLQIVRKQLDIMSTYHYVQNQGKLMMQSPENSQKPQFGQLFEIFKVKYVSPNFKFFWKSVSLKLKIKFSTNFRPKTLLELFLRKISVSDFGLIWRPFCKYLQIKNFFQKSGSVIFLPI